MPPRTGDLPSISVRRPILAIVMNLLIVIAGIAAMLGVEIRELPNVERPVVTVRVNYPGAAPETMDAEVTRALEGAAARVSGVRSISSASEEGNARVRVYFDPSVDINDAANDLREAVSEAQRRLPAGIENLVAVKANDESDPIIRLSVWSETLTQEGLTSLIDDQVVPALLGVPGVADVSLYGNQQRTLNVVVDPQRLASYRLSIGDIADALETAKLDVPAGSMRAAEQDLIVRADASVIEEDQIERIVVRGTTRIGDLASVFYGPEEALSYVRLDGKPVMGLGVIRQAQSNTIQIADDVDRTVADLDRRLNDLRIVKTSDDAIFIRGAINEVLLTLGLGIAIVILVILVFIGSIRITVIPAITIPVALIGTVAAIWLFGFSVNILTLLALVLATGIVVDDAIVVLENIERTRRAGLGRLAAAVLGTRQVFFAVIATTVTLASVFIPIAFLPGRAGQLFTEFGYVLAVSVGISSFVALSICPMLASRLVEPERTDGPPGRVRAALARVGEAVGNAYERSLTRAMRAPILVAGLSLGLAAAVASLYQSLDQELVPREDRGAIIISLQGPDGVNLDYSDRQVAKVEALLLPLVESGEVEQVMSIIGRWDLNRGFIIAPLAPWGERRSQEEITRELQPQLDQIPGARVRIRNPNSLNIRTSGSGLEFAVTGPDYGRIADAGETLVAAMGDRMPGAVGPRMEYSTTQPQLSVRIDRERAADLGVEVDGIAAILRSMVDGTEVTELNVADQAVPVMIRSLSGVVNDTDDLRNLYVATQDDRVVPLSSLISLEENAVAAQLDREGQRRAIDIEADLAPGYALNEALRDLEDLAGALLPPGMSILRLGQAEALEETTRDLAITFVIAIIVVLLVLAAQFESFFSAIVVMVTVPFGLAAAVFALWLTGSSLNVYSQIGLVMLVGLMAKNGILIVEFADQLRDEGLSVRAAALKAAAVRLRPVTMTMLSTTLAGLPLILSAGPGAEARQSIGWVVFGGVGIAIVATLYMTPIVYSLLAPLARSRGDFGQALEAQLDDARKAGQATAPAVAPSSETRS